MGIFKAKPEALEQRAEQFRTRAYQLDRDGKHIKATVERNRAEKYEKAAQKMREKA